MVVITMLGALGANFSLPEQQRPGPFNLRDTMTVREMLYGTAAPYLECMRRGSHDLDGGDPAFGWVQIGV